MAEQMPETERRIRRAVILTNGPAAEAVAEMVWGVSRDWLGIDPPLAVARGFLAAAGAGDWAAPPPEGGQPEQSDAVLAHNGTLLDEACAGLVRGPRIAALRAAGWELARGTEIQAWLLVDVAAAGAAPGALGMLLPVLADRVWEQARVHVVWRGVVLAEPAQERQAAQWVAVLAAAGVEGILVAGPVDADRLRWEPTIWQERTATALAALIWGEADPLNQASLAAAESGVVAWSAGATAWRTPLALIKEQVALRCARMLLARWLATPEPATAGPRWTTTAEAATLSATAVGSSSPTDSENARAQHPGRERLVAVDLPPWEAPGLTVAPEQLRGALEAGVAPAPDGHLWAHRRPGWYAVHGLADELQATAEACAAPAKAEQYEQRGAWLGGQVAAWEADLTELRRRRLTPAAGDPQLRLFALELQGLAVQVQSATVRIEDWLDAAGRQYERATGAVQSAHQALAELCAAFPAATAAGLRAALRSLWRWPGLAWAYLTRLPRAAQRYLDACARQWQARRTEANIHALRQAHLALAQAVQACSGEVAAVLELVERAAAELAQRADAATLPLAPWDAARLAALAARLLPAVQVGLSEMLAADELAAAATVEGAVAADHLLAGIARRLPALLPWSAADCLAEGLADADLERWLARQVAEATPLWPGAGLEAGARVWLLTPHGAELPGRPHSVSTGRLEAAFQAARMAGQKAMQLCVGRTQADGVLVLRLAPVQLEASIELMTQK